jgi:glycosyltransferase involved in cell wall biosynthesis
VLLGRWLGVPVTVTLRGTEARHAKDPRLAGKLKWALRHASRVFSVSESLRQVALSLGIAPNHVCVVGNGVDLLKFSPLPQREARLALNLPPDAPVLITVGALVERKGFHRVIELIPALRERFPGLIYLIVGGSSPEGDWTVYLKEQVGELGIGDAVRFLGPVAPDDLRLPLSAASVFVLATRNEGWANVLLEAMGCGIPVVATDVGGNAEVISSPEFGAIVPFGDPQALQRAIEVALTKSWDTAAILAHAQRNAWDQRVTVLVHELSALCPQVQPDRPAHTEAGHA